MVGVTVKTTWVVPLLAAFDTVTGVPSTVTVNALAAGTTLSTVSVKFRITVVPAAGTVTGLTAISAGGVLSTVELLVTEAEEICSVLFPATSCTALSPGAGSETGGAYEIVTTLPCGIAGLKAKITSALLTVTPVGVTATPPTVAVNAEAGAVVLLRTSLKRSVMLSPFDATVVD
jgi:hypothetical protein